MVSYLIQMALVVLQVTFQEYPSNTKTADNEGHLNQITRDYSFGANIAFYAFKKNTNSSVMPCTYEPYVIQWDGSKT